MAGSCEHVNEPWGSIKGSGFPYNRTTNGLPKTWFQLEIRHRQDDIPKQDFQTLQVEGFCNDSSVNEKCLDQQSSRSIFLSTIERVHLEYDVATLTT